MRGTGHAGGGLELFSKARTPSRMSNMLPFIFPSYKQKYRDNPYSSVTDVRSFSIDFLPLSRILKMKHK